MIIKYIYFIIFMKSLIIAPPNSASESLMYVINNYSNFRCRQIFLYNELFCYNIRRRVISHLLRLQFFKGISLLLKHRIFNLINYFSPINKLKNTNPTNNFKYLSQIHSDICDFDLKLIRDFNSFLNNHENLILKQHFPPTENNKAYFKDYKKIILTREVNGILNKYSSHVDTISHYSYLNNGLKEDVINWVDGWSDQENSIVINFKDFTLNPYKELKKIENFTNIKFNLDKDFVLPVINKTKDSIF